MPKGISNTEKICAEKDMAKRKRFNAGPGRPPKHVRRDGLFNNNCVNESLLVEKYALRFAILVYVPPRLHNAAKARVARSRLLHIQLDYKGSAKATVPSKDDSLDEWLERNMFDARATNQNNRKGKCFPVCEKLFMSLSDRRSAAYGFMMKWLRFFQDDRFIMEFDTTCGFGIYAKERIPKPRTSTTNVTLLGGWMEPDLLHKDFAMQEASCSSGQKLRGTLFGPVAYANSGCSTHTQMCYTSQYNGRQKNCPIAKDAQILIRYDLQTQKLDCPVCLQEAALLLSVSASGAVPPASESESAPSSPDGDGSCNGM